MASAALYYILTSNHLSTIIE